MKHRLVTVTLVLTALAMTPCKAASVDDAGRAAAADDARSRANEPQKKAPRPPRTSNRCYTPWINCVEFEQSRVGSSCWCITPFGPSYGEIR